MATLPVNIPPTNSKTENARFKINAIKIPRGERGFGYDPIFVPDGESRTVAEMSDDEKNAISHRANALKALVEKI